MIQLFSIVCRLNRFRLNVHQFQKRASGCLFEVFDLEDSHREGPQALLYRAGACSLLTMPTDNEFRDTHEPPPAPILARDEFNEWSFYRAIIAEFIATLLFLYVSLTTLMGTTRIFGGSVGLIETAWAFGGMIFILVYCTAGISGGHINPAVTFGLFLAQQVTLPRASAYIVAQCLGAIVGAAIARGVQEGGEYRSFASNAVNGVQPGYNIGQALAAEIMGTFVLLYAVLSATDPTRKARDSHVPVLAPLPIGFAIFVVHLATIPITGTGINPARSLGAAVAKKY